MSTKYSVGVLDDRQRTRDTTITLLRRKLPEWDVLAVPLPATAAAAAVWIRDRNVSVLLVDQLLNEQHDSGETHVTYKGHDVVTELRKSRATFPIYILTAHPEDADIPAHYGQVEGVMARGEFSSKLSAWIEQMTRAAHAVTAHEKDLLSKLAVLSQKKASNSLSAQEEKDLKAIQSELDLRAGSPDRIEVLLSLEKEMKRLAKVQKKIETLVARSKNK